MSYSYDLRVRVVEAYKNQEGSYRKLADRFKVHYHTVRLWIFIEKEENRLKPNHKSGNTSPLQMEHRDYLEQLYGEKCDLTHREVCEKLKTEFGMDLSESSLSYGLKRLGITRKKKSSRPQKI